MSRETETALVILTWSAVLLSYCADMKARRQNAR